MTPSRLRRAALVAALAAAGSAVPALGQQPPAGAARPNIIVLVVDDLRFDELGVTGHPFAETPNIDRLAREGALFTNAFHVVSLCSPNRASILTGQYPSRHGIIDNVTRGVASYRLETFPRVLQANGYETGLIGKWHMGNDAAPRPGFDYWAVFPGQGRTADPELYEDGRLHVVPGYVTDILTERALAFIARPRQRPFFLYIGEKAIHPDVQQRNDGSIDPNTDLGYVPAARHRGRYAGRAWPPRPNVIASLDSLRGQPAIREALAELVSGDTTPRAGLMAPRTADTTIQRRAEMLLSVDEGLGRIYAALEAAGTLDNTVIILTSDNGFFFGEHGLSTERRLPYEESIRNPLLVRYPPRVPAGSRPAQLVLSIDIAPTVLELAGLRPGPGIQGRSLVPLFGGGRVPWRSSLLVEFTSYENPFPHLVDLDYRALRTDRYKYVRWLKHPDQDELYDLRADPYEMHNVANDSAAAAVKRQLQAELNRQVVAALGLAVPR